MKRETGEGYFFVLFYFFLETNYNEDQKKKKKMGIYNLALGASLARPKWKIVR